MEEPVDLAALCKTMLDANHALFAAGYFESAYHALATALHCAADAGDARTLRHIQTIVADQRRHIVEQMSAATSEYPDRGTTRWASLERIYASAEQQIRTRAVTIEFRITPNRSQRDA